MTKAYKLCLALLRGHASIMRANAVSYAPLVMSTYWQLPELCLDDRLLQAKRGIITYLAIQTAEVIQRKRIIAASTNKINVQQLRTVL